MAIDRRSLLRAGGGGMMLALPGLALARASGERRLVFVMLRGGMDGLSAVMPVGDPAYRAARGGLADPREADGAPILIGSDFALHPALAGAGAMTDVGELLVVHGVASPYRERSHFDAQKLVETGGATPLALDSGWLNRALPMLNGSAIAVTPGIPLALRGMRPVTSYAPSNLPDASADLMERVNAMYADDPLLHPLWQQAVAAKALADGGGVDGGGRPDPARLATMAAGFLKEANGPRIAMLEMDGWDTHAQQPARIANQLRGLDRVLATLKDGLGPLWSDTLVVAVTEFGRTARPNGTGGTDHGTATAAFLAGGTVAGGRVAADWPGLAPAQLLDGRDLRPTVDLRSVLLGGVAGHFGLDPAAASRAWFPDSSVKAMVGLVRA